MGRVDFDPSEMEPRAFYRLLTAAILPRPIAWVSSRSAAGIDNLAPHSLYTCSCVDPPVLQFTSVGRKDSQTNIEETGEFVVNFSPEHLFEEINATATDFPPEVSEFEAVGIVTEESARVAPLRVAESPVAFECKLVHTHSFGDSTVIFGEVVHAAVDEGVITGDRGLPDVDLLRPLARLGKIEWATLGDVREITRIPHEDWPGHYEPSDSEDAATDGDS
jgi:flavin reductase (DIM6/NTAB) family NADH-FMN oxidoreductase RutF